MKLNILPASLGSQWIRQSLRIFKANLAFFLANTGIYILLSIALVMVLSYLPILAAILIGVLGIYFTMTVMLACEHFLHQKNKKENYLTSSLFSHVWSKTLKNKRILVLSLIIALISTGIYSLINLVTSLIFADVYASAEAALESIQNSPNMEVWKQLTKHGEYFSITQAVNLISRFIVFSLFCMTPAIIYWGNTSYAQAIFYNFIATLKNWRTWALWFLTWFAIMMVFSIALTIIMLIFSGVPTLLTLLRSLLVIAVIILSLALINMVPICYFLAYQDSFIVQKEKENTIQKSL